jgi:hypothetical protein
MAEERIPVLETRKLGIIFGGLVAVQILISKSITASL